jgi:hypothetical protein
LINARVYGSGAGVKPTGTITFYDGDTPLTATVTYSGHDGTTYGIDAELDGSINYTFNSIGMHSISAKYSGDSLYLPSTAYPYNLQIAGPFNIVPTGPVSVVAGQTGTTTLTLSSNNNFIGDVTLTCMPSPSAKESTCGFAQGTTAAQSSITVNLGGTSVPVTFSVSTTAAHTLTSVNRELHGITWLGLAVGGVFVLGIPALRRKPAVVLTLLLLALTFTAASCGGGGSSGTPPPPQIDPGTSKGTYTFSVTGTTGSGANAITVPTQVTVVVN